MGTYSKSVIPVYTFYFTQVLHVYVDTHTNIYALCLLKDEKQKEQVGQQGKAGYMVTKVFNHKFCKSG